LHTIAVLIPIKKFHSLVGFAATSPATDTKFTLLAEYEREKVGGKLQPSFDLTVENIRL